MKRAKFSAADTIRRLLVSWLAASLLQYLLVGGAQRALSGLSSVEAMSFGWLIAEVLLFFAALTALALFYPTARWERWGLVLLVGVYGAIALRSSFTLPFAVGCALVFLMAAIYALRGMTPDAERTVRPKRQRKAFAVGLLAVLVAVYVLVNGAWQVCRVKGHLTSTYDFGIFAQMFENMRKSGLPNTTLERDGLLSHFKVHVSPIYYLWLPFYALFPHAETLQILQVLTAASAVIPLWLLARRHGFSPLTAALLSGLLLVYPAYSAGMYYDLHENVFLTPLILWLFYALDSRKAWAVALFSVLVFAVKEDAAVYVAVAAVWLLLRTLLRERGRQRVWGLATAGAMLLGAVVWFLLVTAYLAQHGDGVMTYRYGNFMYGGSTSLLTVVQTVLLNPMKLLYECAKRYEYFLLVMAPVLFLPLLTRKYERLLLLIPLILLNLMPDYQYQHSIYCQYSYGTAAFLFYLTVCNLADLPLGKWAAQGKAGLSIVGVLVGLCVTLSVIGESWVTTVRYCVDQREKLSAVDAFLEQIPADATVSTTTYYTTRLTYVEELYDLWYCSEEHILASDYVVLQASGSFHTFNGMGTDGKWTAEDACAYLEDNGFALWKTLGNSLLIYHK